MGATFHTFVAGEAADAFVQTCTQANVGFNYTNLTHASTDANPDALVFATHDDNPGGVASGVAHHDHALGVFYSTTPGWAVFDQDEAPMPLGIDFNILVTPDGEPSAFTHVAAAANTEGGGRSVIVDPRAEDPDSILVVTQHFNPVGLGGMYNDHPIAVEYGNGYWGIVNQDGVDIPWGVGFNVLVVPVPEPDALLGAISALVVLLVARGRV